MTREHAKTFYFASHVLPPAKRRDAYGVYAFCRYVDDEIDLTSGASAQAAAFARLQAVLAAAYGLASNPDPASADLPWLAAFRDTVRRRHIPQPYFEDLLEGVRMDCGPVRLTTWQELHRYCYHVASVVGQIMVHVLTEPAPGLLVPAQHLGTAMQLTNILRDIGEDWRRDRLYLPRAELEKFGLIAEDIERKRLDDSFRALMRFQIGRARFYYGLAEEGIARLPGDGSRLTVRLMSRLYSAILDEIERADYQVHSRRARVSFARKLWLTVRS
jgi:phytoene synthase